MLSPGKLNPYLDRNRYVLLLILLFIISEIIVNPLRNFPLNDDWSYAKSVMILQNEGKLDIGEWPSMTLVTHLVYGLLFTKIFGFSFISLHLSSIFSSCVGILVLNNLVLKITNNKLTAFFAALCLLFNPLYFSLTNTFMTDVNFNTLLLLGCYFAYDFFQTQRIIPFVLVFIISALLVLVRQFGIILPICFIFACLFIKQKKVLYVGISLVLTLLVVGVLKYYENYLKTVLPVQSAYKYSGGVNFLGETFWHDLFINVELRSKSILLQVLFYTFPFVVIFLLPVLRNFKPFTLILISGLNFVCVFYFFRGESPQMPNIFYEMSLGAETFYESWHRVKGDHGHTYSHTFENILRILKNAFLFINSTILIFFLSKVLKSKMKTISVKPEVVLLVCLFFAYVFMIFMTESYFDRYHIPLISIAIILFAYINNTFQIDYRMAILPLVAFFIVSVFGTKDYYTVNAKKWEAHTFLTVEKKVDPGKIHAGSDLKSWINKTSWWHGELSYFDYLIQYQPEKGFQALKEYEFQRFFPYKKDKLIIYVRIDSTSAVNSEK